MHIELSPASQAKIEDILEQLYTRYDLEDLTAEQLIDALLDLGVDLVVALADLLGKHLVALDQRRGGQLSALFHESAHPHDLLIEAL